MISIACAAPRWRRIVSSRLSSGIDPDQELKAQLARALCDILEAWPQANAAALAHLHESEISRLRNNKLERFSVERLIRLIAAFGYDIGVELKPIPRRFASPRPLPTVSVVRLDALANLAVAQLAQDDML
jgi:predicted XRE-type DNA-binding protein